MGRRGLTEVYRSCFARVLVDRAENVLSAFVRVTVTPYSTENGFLSCMPDDAALNMAFQY